MATMRLVGRAEMVDATGPCGGGQVQPRPQLYLFRAEGDTDPMALGECFTVAPYELSPPNPPLPPMPSPGGG